MLEYYFLENVCGEIYEASPFKGSFSTVSEFHSALLSLNHEYALVDMEDDDDQFLLSVRQCHLAQPKISLPQYENGPFVVNHYDLSSFNILVCCCLARLPLIYINQIDDDYPPAVALIIQLYLQRTLPLTFTDRNLWVQSILDAEPVRAVH